MDAQTTTQPTRTRRVPISKVVTLAFVMPVYDLTAADEMVPTTEGFAVEHQVWAWDHDSQSWEHRETFGTEREARERARELHEELKAALGIEQD